MILPMLKTKIRPLCVLGTSKVSMAAVFTVSSSVKRKSHIEINVVLKSWFGPSISQAWSRLVNEPSEQLT